MKSILLATLLSVAAGTSFAQAASAPMMKKDTPMASPMAASAPMAKMPASAPMMDKKASEPMMKKHVKPRPKMTKEDVKSVPPLKN